MPNREFRKLVLKRLQLLDGFQGNIYKDRMREGVCGMCGQLVDILLIGWWWGNWESIPSSFWFQPVWDLSACGQHTVSVSYQVGVSVSAKQLIRHAQNIIYSPGRRTKGPRLCLMAKVIIILFCLTVFLSICIFSLLVTFSLWLKFFYRQKAGRGCGWEVGRPRRLPLGYSRKSHSLLPPTETLIQ